MDKNFILKRADVALGALFLLLAISLVFIFIALEASDGYAFVVISVDGAEVFSISLAAAEGESFEFITEFGHNEVAVNGGVVRMHFADCPDLLCLHQAPIHFSFQTIVCLPNRLVVELRTNQTEAITPDAIIMKYRVMHG